MQLAQVASYVGIVTAKQLQLSYKTEQCATYQNVSAITR